MTRTLPLMALAALVATAALLASPPARACDRDPPPPGRLLGGHHRVRCHEVLYRTGRDQPWRLYDSYSDRRTANDAARELRRGGYQTRVDHY